MNQAESYAARAGVAGALVLAVLLGTASGARAQETRGAPLGPLGSEARLEVSPERSPLSRDAAEVGAVVGLSTRHLAFGRPLEMAFATGYVHELGGDDGVWAEVALATHLDRVRVEAEATARHMLSSLRDPIDVLASARAEIDLVPSLSVGAECVIPDLEDAWDDEERDGGARAFAGPTAAFRPTKRLRISAGPSLGMLREGPRVVERVSIAWLF